MQYEFKKLINIPFVDGGRDPATGLDCWGLMMAGYKMIGREVKDFKIGCFQTVEIYMAAVQEATINWLPVKQPQFGDAVTLSMDDKYPGLIQHFGMMVSPYQFLHTLQKTGSIITETVHPFFRYKITGYLRPL